MIAERTAPRVRSVPEDHVVLLHRQPHVAHLHAAAGFDPVTSAAASPAECRLAEIVAVYVVGVVVAENAIEDAAGWCRERGVAAAATAAATAAEAVVEVGRAGLRRRAVLLGVVGIVIVVRVLDWKLTFFRARVTRARIILDN